MVRCVGFANARGGRWIRRFVLIVTVTVLEVREARDFVGEVVRDARVSLSFSIIFCFIFHHSTHTPHQLT